MGVGWDSGGKKPSDSMMLEQCSRYDKSCDSKSVHAFVLCLVSSDLYFFSNYECCDATISLLEGKKLDESPQMVGEISFIF